jgi:hypothetical protein
MRHLDYVGAVVIRGAFDRIVDGKASNSNVRRDACVRVSDGDLEDPRIVYVASRYTFVAWLGLATLFLLVWLACIFSIRYGFDISTLDSLPVSVGGRVLFGLVLSSMAWAGIALTGEIEKLYLLKGGLGRSAWTFGSAFLSALWLGYRFDENS